MAKLVSKTYGEALYEVAVEDGAVESLLEEVEAVLEVINANEEYVGLLTHPKLPVEEKITLVENAFKGKVSDNLVGFLITIVEKGRFAEIQDILSCFVDKVREHQKIGVACVTSAITLTEAQRDDVEKRLLATTSYVKFIMNYSVDPSLIGGMVIQIGDRVVDSSIKTKLNEMEKDLSQIQLAN